MDFSYEEPRAQIFEDMMLLHSCAVLETAVKPKRPTSASFSVHWYWRSAESPGGEGLSGVFLAGVAVFLH
jgi:hypothetical protein